MEIEIKPKLDALESLGLSEAEFDDALELALNRLAGTPKAELPTPLSIPITVRGEQHALGELALIDVYLDSGQQALRL